MHANISILILIYYLSTVKRKFSFSRLYFITKVFNFTASQYYFENTDKDKTERKIKKNRFLCQPIYLINLILVRYALKRREMTTRFPPPLGRILYRFNLTSTILWYFWIKKRFSSLLACYQLKRKSNINKSFLLYYCTIIKHLFNIHVLNERIGP